MQHRGITIDTYLGTKGCVVWCHSTRSSNVRCVVLSLIATKPIRKTCRVDSTAGFRSRAYLIIGICIATKPITIHSIGGAKEENGEEGEVDQAANNHNVQIRGSERLGMIARTKGYRRKKDTSFSGVRRKVLTPRSGNYVVNEV
jgi:hypothetical protein